MFILNEIRGVELQVIANEQVSGKHVVPFGIPMVPFWFRLVTRWYPVGFFLVPFGIPVVPQNTGR